MKRIPLLAVLAGLTFGAGNVLAAADGAGTGASDGDRREISVNCHRV